MHNKAAVVSGVKWTALSTFGRRILALLSNILLARLLTPTDFGLVAMAAVVLGFIEIFKDLGTGAALIQKKEISDDFLSSIFWLNVAFGATATVVAIATAPLVAAFFHEPQVAPVFMAMAASFLLSALSIVHGGLLTRHMAFNALAKIELAAAILSYVIGIGAAVLGHGVWSLVYQVITNSLINFVLVWWISPWRPRMVFHWIEVKSVMGYSLNLSAYNIFYYFALNAANILIGRYLGAKELGFYDLAYRLMSFPLQAISAVFARVMAPYYAAAQDDLPRFRQAYLQVAVAIAFITFPLMFGLFAVKEHFVMVVFGPTWEPVILLLALFAPLGAIRSILTTTGSIFIAKGRADLQFKWGVFSNLFVIAALAIGVNWGSVGVAAAFTLSSLFLLYHNFSIPFKLIELKIRDLGRALQRTALCAFLMYVVIYLLDLLFGARLGHGIMLPLTVLSGIATYVTLTWVLNRAVFDEVLHLSGLRRRAELD